MHEIKQLGNEFVNVFTLSVSIENNKLICFMQDYHCNLIVVECQAIEQMLNHSVVFDQSVKVITNGWLADEKIPI
ncbi:MAG: hypothetical protein ACK518_00830 [bacterium]|jgi:hypothetical protein